jgi:restriction endonuclease S subunit
LIPIPELNEQKKIIKKLDVAFEMLKKVNDDIEEKKKLIIDLKRSIINSVTLKDE